MIYDGIKYRLSLDQGARWAIFLDRGPNKSFLGPSGHS